VDDEPAAASPEQNHSSEIGPPTLNGFSSLPEANVSFLKPQKGTYQLWPKNVAFSKLLDIIEQTGEPVDLTRPLEPSDREVVVHHDNKLHSLFVLSAVARKRVRIAFSNAIFDYDLKDPIPREADQELLKSLGLS